MAIIYSYPIVPPSGDDLLFGTDATQADKPTKNFTVQSIVDIVAGGAAGLGAVLKISSNAQDFTDPLNPVNQPIQNLTFINGTGSATFNSFTDGILNITAGNLTTTGNGTFANITGILLTVAQPNVTSLGILTSLRIGGAAPAVNLIDTSITAPGLDTSLVTEKAVVTYVTSQTETETLAETLVKGNVTGGTDIIVSNDDDALIQGNATINFQPTAGTNNSIISASKITNSIIATTYSIDSRKFALQRENGGTNYLSTASTGVGTNGSISLYGDGVKKLTAVGHGLDIVGTIFSDNGQSSGPTYSFTSDTGTGMYRSATNEIGFSSNQQTIVKIGPHTAAGASTEVHLGVTGLTRSTTYDTNTSTGPISRFVLSDDPAVPQTTPTTFGLFVAGLVNDTMVPTTSAVKAYVDNQVDTKTLNYKDAATDIYQMNLFSDKIQFESGNANITLAAAAVTGTIANITTTLANDVTLSGFMKADNFKTTAGTATWVTTVLDGFTKITSISDATPPLAGFVGDTSAAIIPVGGAVGSNNVQFQGNASTANSLKSTGQIAISTTANINKGVTAPFVTYTDGGTVSLVSELLPATVTAKTLGGLVIPATGNSIEPDDSILSAFGKLQAQRNTSANGLRFVGTWNSNIDNGGTNNAPNGTPALLSGGGTIVTGTTTSIVADQLVDSTKNFGTSGLNVAVGERVYNQAGAFTTVSAAVAATQNFLILNEDIFTASLGQTYSVDNDPALNQGEYYVVNAINATLARNATLNTIQNWQVGDWVIAGANNTWERLDQTSVEGVGTINTIPKWISVTGIADSSITDTGALITLGDVTNLGAATTDAITSVGSHEMQENLFLKKGVGVGAGNDYGTSGFYLATSGSAATAPSWIAIPDTGVTGVTGGDGIKITGTAAVPIVSIDYLGSDNAILKATNISSGIIALTDQIWFNDVGTGATANTLKYAPISKIKDIINTYSWKLDANGLAATVIAEDDQVGFNNGVGIIQSRNVRDITTALRYEDSDNTGTIKNFVEAAATLVNPVGADFLVFSDQAGDSAINKVNKATISSIVALGDQNLTQVLAKGSSSGGANSINMTGAISNIFLPDSGTAASPSTDQGRIKLGTGEDLQIYHNGTNGYVTNSTGGLILEGTSQASLGFSTGESGVTATKDGDVKLYNDNRERLRTTSGGVEIVNTDDENSFPSITMTQDSKLFTITTGLVGNAELRTQGSMSLNTSGVINFKNYASTLTKGSLGDSFDFNPANAAGNGVVNGFTVGQSSDATAAGTLTHVYGDLQVDGAINHGSGKGGIFTGSMSFVAATAKTLFYLTRTTNGQLLFDVYLTSATAGYACKKYTVAHGFNLNPTYNKIIDSIPIANGDYVVTFTNDGIGVTGDTVKCSITATTAQDIYYSLQVGFGSTTVSISTD